MKKILVLVDQVKPGHQMIADFIQKELSEKGMVTLGRFSDLFIYLSQNKVEVTLDGRDIKEFDLVYIRRAGKFLSLSYTLATILKSFGIPFMDTAFGAEGALGDKFTALTRLGLAGLPIIESCFVWKDARSNFIEKIDNTFGYPVVAKDRFMQRGHGVSLVNNKDDLSALFTGTKTQQFIFQKFLQSKQEYRLLVLGDEVRVFEKKTPTDPNEFRANVSRGAKEEFLSLSDLTKEMADIATKAAKVLNLEVAGVDILEDTDGNYWLLEVNRGPGLTYDPAISPELTEVGKFFANKLRASK